MGLCAMGLCAVACFPSSARRSTLAHDARAEPSTTPPGDVVQDDRNWHLALFQVRTRDGDWQSRGTPISPTENHDEKHAQRALREAASWGVRAVFFADHNSVAVGLLPSVQSYAKELGITAVPGTEWSLGGPLGMNLPVTLGHAGPHLGLVGYQAQHPQDVLAPKDTRAPGRAEDLLAVMRETHERGGVVVISHPDAVNFDWPDALGPLEADLVEVDGPLVVNPPAARRRWHRWLMDGHRVGAISASHWHVGLLHAWPMERVNLIRSPVRTAEALVDALRAGHVMVVRQPSKVPRVLLGADADGDGVPNDVREGDVFRPAPGETRARVSLRVLGGSGRALLLYGAASADAFHKQTLTDEDTTLAFSVRLDPAHRTFVRAELWDGPDLCVLTNPIYFDPSSNPAELPTATPALPSVAPSGDMP